MIIEKPNTKCFGLLRKCEFWLPTKRGFVLLMVLFLTLCSVVILTIHPFLAVTNRVDTPYLVVEGWIPNYALEEAIQEFRSKPYKLLFTVGGTPLSGTDIEPGDNDADHAYKRLKWLGMDPSKINPVPSKVLYRNRTYQTALSLKDYFIKNNLEITAINVVTVGPHARRSRILFGKAFAGKISVGVISVPDKEYDPSNWWNYSEGVREIISELAAYIYVRFFFWP